MISSRRSWTCFKDDGEASDLSDDAPDADACWATGGYDTWLTICYLFTGKALKHEALCIVLAQIPATKQM